MKGFEMDGGPIAIVPLQFAILCENCLAVLDSRQIRGECCPACTSVGAMMSLSRILQPLPQLGQVTYMRIGTGD